MRRRAFLAGTAAAGAGLACRRRTPGFEGQIVGPSLELGHQIRDGQLPEASHFTPIDAVIVGGGVAGLAAAWRMAGAGFTDFVLLEMDEQVGGTAKAGHNGISPYPWGAHYIPAPTRENPALLRLLKECGVVEGEEPSGEPRFGEQFLVRAPEERIFAAGQWWEGLYLRAGASAEDERQYHAFFQEVERWALWRDGRGRRAFAIPRSKGSDDPEVRSLDRLSFKEWLDRRALTSERLRWLLDYACRDDYGARLETTSAWAGLFYFAARKPSKGEESRPLLAWPEGNGFLVERLRRPNAERIRTGVAVTSLRNPTPGLLHVLAYDVRAKAPVGFAARRVIFAGPQHVAGHVIPTLWEDRPEGLTAFIQSPWLVANLTLRERPREAGFPLAWDNVLRDSPGLGYVVATHQSLHDYGPSVWTYYRPFAGVDVREARERLQAMDWKACCDLVLGDLHRAHPDLESRLARLDVMRWGHAMVRPRPGFCWSEALRKAAEPHRGIHFAHTDLSGLALFEEALDHGLRAAEEVLGALGRPSGSWR